MDQAANRVPRQSGEPEVLHDRELLEHPLVAPLARHVADAVAARGLFQPTARPGRPPTAWVVKVGARPILLDDSGRPQAGEKLQALLAQREAGLEKPRVMSDALASHTAPAAEVIQGHCLAPGRRKGRDLAAGWPAAGAVVLEALKPGDAPDAEARDQPFPPAPEPAALGERHGGVVQPGDLFQAGHRYRGSFDASTSTFSIEGGLARSSGAFAMRAAATLPERCASRPFSSGKAS